MIAVDTNVLARWILGDDPVQTPVATAVLERPVFVSLTVMLELGWVLHKALRFERQVAAAMLERVLAIDTANIEHAELAAWAVERFRKGADWGDMLHLTASSRESVEFVTFDRRLSRSAGSDSPVPVSMLTAQTK